VLKGVWNDRRYPIIWYEKDWDKVKDTFLYDERFENSIVERVQRETKTSPSISELSSVLDDHNRLNALKDLYLDLDKGRLADEQTVLLSAFAVMGIFLSVNGLRPSAVMQINGNLAAVNSRKARHLRSVFSEIMLPILEYRRYYQTSDGTEVFIFPARLTSQQHQT